MTIVAQQYKVAGFGPQFVYCKRNDVVDVHLAAIPFLSAPLARPMISPPYNLRSRRPLQAGINGLSFRGYAAEPMRVFRAGPAEHPIDLSGQPPMFLSSDIRHGPSLNAMLAKPKQNGRLGYAELIGNIRRAPLFYGVLGVQPVTIPKRLPGPPMLALLELSFRVRTNALRKSALVVTVFSHARIIP